MIQADETEIRGLWFSEGGRMHANVDCDRIKALIANHLNEIARAKRGWERLYRDPFDNRLWEMSYPFGGGQAAGPPTLRCVELEAVRERFGLV